MEAESTNASARDGPLLLRVLDAFAFSSALVACAAAALAAAASRALGFAPEPAVLALALCGTVVVYCLDRVRDLPRDGRTSPLRSAFVAAHRRAMLAAAALAAFGALAAGALAGARVVATAGAVGAFGLAHRRLKRFTWAKPLYLTGSWTAVSVGLPAAAASADAALDFSRLVRVALVVGATVQANVILSNLRDAEGIAGRLGAPRARTLAAAFCVAALGLALAGAREVRALALLPLAMSAAVAAFRPGERYGAGAVDGALLLGAGAALLAP
jgi:4-hydroxybenzoate polyprenyltransferase